MRPSWTLLGSGGRRHHINILRGVFFHGEKTFVTPLVAAAEKIPRRVKNYPSVLVAATKGVTNVSFALKTI